MVVVAVVVVEDGFCAEVEVLPVRPLVVVLVVDVDAVGVAVRPPVEVVVDVRGELPEVVVVALLVRAVSRCVSVRSSPALRTVTPPLDKFCVTRRSNELSGCCAAKSLCECGCVICVYPL